MPTEGQPTEESSDLNRIPNEARGQQALLLDTLFDNLTGCLGIFSSVPGRTKSIGSVELHSLTGAYFDYQTGLNEALVWAENNAAAGKDLHLCPHLLTARRRIKRNAAAVKALWADADEAELPEGFPLPTVTVQSSPGKRHLYWALRRVIEPEAAEELSRRLTHTIEADPGGWPLTSLFRLPGTNNLKYPAGTRVEMVAYDATNVYHPREIEQYLKEEEKEKEELTPLGEVPAPAVVGQKELLTIHDLHRLSPRMQSLISLGNEAAGKPYKTRSHADFAVAIAMLGAGFEEAAIRQVLTDPTNGISIKFFERGKYGDYYVDRTIRRARERAQPAFPSARKTARRHRAA